MRKFILTTFFLTVIYQCHTQIISTVAGNKNLNFSYSGDGGLATNAGMSGPSNIAVDNNNNLYISDRGNNVIRKVSPNGIITTIAGNGTGGYSGDNGPATLASLFHPEGIAVDNNGNIYFSDNDNHRIRKISAGGIISTIAGTGNPGNSGNGGPATLANIQSPTGLDIDNSGNVYFTAPFHNLIKKIDVNGIITTFAGNGGGGRSGDGGMAINASIGVPEGIFIDNNENVYVSGGFFNQVIRKINPAGIISTFAGNGSVGNNGDGGPAVNAELSFPKGMCSDPDGNFYIASELAHCIKKVNTSGVISTFSGDVLQNCGYSGDGGLANLAKLCFPRDIACDSDGNLYIADRANGVIRKISFCPVVDAIAGGADEVCEGASTPAFTNSTPGGVWSAIPVTGSATITQQGIVTGVLAGTVTIEYAVTAANGCTVTTTKNLQVNDAPPVLCSITAVPTSNIFTGGNPNHIFLGYGAQSTTLTVPQSDEYTYSWSGNGPLSCSNCPDPVFTPTVPGVYTFTVTISTVSCNIQASCSITICVTDIRVPGTDGNKVYLCHAPSGNPDNTQQLQLSINAVAGHLSQHSGDRLGRCTEAGCQTNSFVKNGASLPEENSATNHKPSIYPNPSTGSFAITLPAEIINRATITIKDTWGRVAETVNTFNAGASIRVGEQLKPGIYFLEIADGKKRQVYKIVRL